MKRLLLAIITLFCLLQDISAAHIKGGFFTYQYLGTGSSPGTARYRITLTVYMICSASPGQVSNPINFSIFSATNFSLVQNPTVNITNEYFLGKVYDEPCISGNQIGCYYKIVVYDLPSIELPVVIDGYIVSYQRCCRIAGINNVVGSSNVGNTFWIKIPGTAQFPGAETNSSPSFLVNDTAVVCSNSYFQYSFQATDINGDSLSYSFCQAYLGGDSGGNPAPNPANPPPYTPIPYQFPYSGIQPMGPGVTINPNTGLISGIAPSASGQYVLCVCVNEYRNGILVGVTRKELHIEVGNCNPLQARLDPRPATCDGFTVSFQNDAGGNPPGAEYLWTFGEPSSGSSDTSILATPTHTYADTGVYLVRLKVSLAGGLCADSATLTVRVFPGFFPDFSSSGICVNKPTLFTDLTSTAYGVVNSWQWDFGDLTTSADISNLQNPSWTYPTIGTKNARLIVTNSKGCIDTIIKTVDIIDKPPIALGFRDTLLCRGDAVQLQASGSGVWNWSPNISITDPNTATPTVNPNSTTWYHVQLDNNGCINNDSVRIRIINAVTLQAIADTTICEGDQIQLGANTDGLQYSWTPVNQVDNPNILNPIATTPTTTTYQIVSTVGSCSATDFVTVTTVPYPGSNAGPDTTICYNTPAQLNGTIAGSSFTWTPTTYLNNSTILNPIATPPRTTTFVLTVYDNLGCPKPGHDTVVVNVIPKLQPFAGRDTSVIVGQPLQFNASGGSSYLWIPAFGLNDPNIADPIGLYNSEIDSLRYKVLVMEGNCIDSAFVTVRVYKTVPYIFVPSAFTPNGDGLNDVVRPIAVGIKKINYFRIYNRWGQMVFSTSTNGHGWDGRIAGRLQSTNTFVWIVSAVDYQDKPYFMKGTVTLIK